MDDSPLRKCRGCRELDPVPLDHEPLPEELRRALDRLETLTMLQLNFPGSAGTPARRAPATPRTRRAPRATPRAPR